MPIVQSLMEAYQAVQVDAQYGDTIEVIVEIEVSQVDGFTQAVINKSGAKASVTPIEN